MLKINGNIESISAVENIIKKVPHKDLSDNSTPYPIQGQEFASRVQTKVLAVEVDPMKLKVNYGLIKKVMKSEVLRVRETVAKDILISFYYDYRNDEANIKVDPEEVVILCDIVKGLKETIANIKASNVQSVPQPNEN